MFKQKKGALELSINAIVIIVLAMTVLGLGLGFIRNQFGQIGDIGTGVTEQIKQSILEDLRTGNKKLSVPTTEVQIGRRDATVLASGIKNVESKSINFVIQLKEVEAPEAEVLFRYQNITFLGQAGKDPYPFTLGPAEAEVYPIRIETGTTTGTNTYEVKVVYASEDTSGTCPQPAQQGETGNWCIEPKLYAQKTLFLTVQ